MGQHLVTVKFTIHHFSVNDFNDLTMDDDDKFYITFHHFAVHDFAFNHIVNHKQLFMGTVDYHFISVYFATNNFSVDHFSADDIAVNNFDNVYFTLNHFPTDNFTIIK